MFDLDNAPPFHIPTLIKGVQECERDHDTMRRVFNAMIEMNPDAFCKRTRKVRLPWHGLTPPASVLCVARFARLIVTSMMQSCI